MTAVKDGSEMRCPVCGVGVLTDIAFDAGARDGEGKPVQDTSGRQLVSFSCGHRELGPRLETADAERLAVERRGAEDTIDPLPEQEAGP